MHKLLANMLYNSERCLTLIRSCQIDCSEKSIIIILLAWCRYEIFLISSFFDVLFKRSSCSESLFKIFVSSVFAFNVTSETFISVTFLLFFSSQCFLIHSFTSILILSLILNIDFQSSSFDILSFWSTKIFTSFIWNFLTDILKCSDVTYINLSWVTILISRCESFHLAFNLWSCWLSYVWRLTRMRFSFCDEKNHEFILL